MNATKTNTAMTTMRTRTTRIRVTSRTTRYDGNGDHAAAKIYDNDGYDEDQNVTMEVKDARKTKRRHGEDDGYRKDEEDEEDETTKTKTRRTMKLRRGGREGRRRKQREGRS